LVAQMVHAVALASNSPVTSSPSSSSSPVFCPHPAFAVQYGDTLLQSSDRVFFGVHRCILMQASTVFADLLRLPASIPACLPASVSPRRDPIILSESAQTLDTLFRLIYPFPPPTFDDLSDLVPVLIASIKYKMTSACAVLRRHLISPTFLIREPLRVFAVACRFGLKPEAREASRATLTINLLDGPLYEDLRYVSAYDYHRLLALHHSRGQAARRLLNIRSKDCPVRCSGCSEMSSSGRQLSPPRWWQEFQTHAKEEVTRRPLTDIIFSMRFLSECANAGCTACGASVLNSFVFMENLKAKMDSLPDTISFEGEDEDEDGDE
jgi:hypothetical protein